MHVQTQKIAPQRVAAMAYPDGFQSGKQTALLFIEQTVEQKDRSLEFIGRHLQTRGVNGHRNGLSTAAGERLCTPLHGADSGVEKLAADIGPAQALLLDQMAQ